MSIVYVSRKYIRYVNIMQHMFCYVHLHFIVLVICSQSMGRFVCGVDVVCGRPVETFWVKIAGRGVLSFLHRLINQEFISGYFLTTVKVFDLDHGKTWAAINQTFNLEVDNGWSIINSYSRYFHIVGGNNKGNKVVQSDRIVLKIGHDWSQPWRGVGYNIGVPGCCGSPILYVKYTLN